MARLKNLALIGVSLIKATLKFVLMQTRDHIIMFV